MRDIFLALLFLALAVRTVKAPQAGVLGWTWITLMAPHTLAWGFISGMPVNMILAIITLLAWVASKEPKRIPMNLAVGLWLLFMAYITFTTMFALAPDVAWNRWDRTIKIMSLGLLVAGLMNNRVRIQSLVWVIVASIGYFGIKGGAFTLITGGGAHVYGPESTGLGDNNDLALALCMILPLMNYLRLQSAQRWMRMGAVGAMGLVVVGILGTYSRGGLIGLVIMSGYLWWKSKSKIIIAVVGLIVLVPAIRFMPSEWTDRMSTIQDAQDDNSFEGRVQAWHFAINVATARPFVGAGFSATENTNIFREYMGYSDQVFGHAAHSIYFQVLGDHGFVALGIYLAMLATTWAYTGTIRRRARRVPELAWAEDLAAMIQVSLLAFMVCGAALSMAYYDLIYLLIGLTTVLREIVLRSTVDQRAYLLEGIMPGATPVPGGGVGVAAQSTAGL